MVDWQYMDLGGFVLAGGRSSRMGRDKALLLLDGQPLVQRASALLGSFLQTPVALVGAAARYGHLGLPVIEDRFPGDGPLAGIEAALGSAYARAWNLIVACDMPHLGVDTLRGLAAAAAAHPEAMCVLAVSRRGPEPLCAVWRREFAPIAHSALRAGQRKVRDVLETVPIAHFQIEEDSVLTNVNTPADWAGVAGESAP
ncbi:MAG: molybdenum cofactor guanylyltransferase [Bryobacterales bacterium]|nr:molybdenum cofactor guanylyltransferase [Bryobacterales bacterium]